MTTAIIDKKRKRHLVVSFQLPDKLEIITTSYLAADWITTKQPPRTTYEYMSEVDFHNKLRATIALRNDKIVKEKCIPRFI